MDHLLNEEQIDYFKPSDIVNSSFIIINAKRRSGKSTLVEDLINKQFESGNLDVAILFTGTNAGFDNIDAKFRFTEDEIYKLDDIVENYEVMNEFNKVSDSANKFKIKTIVVLDDLALQYKKKEFSEKLAKLSVQGRHVSYSPLSLSIIVITQKITCLPTTCRCNADYIIFNNISSMTELDTVMNENFFLMDSSREGKKKARNLYNGLVTSEPYLFVVCENHKTNIKKYKDYVKKYVVKL
jgi:hypothetical protein